MSVSPSSLSGRRGCMYFPSDSWNTWQIWADYDESVIERDLDLMAMLNLNTVRVFLSYEFWREEAEDNRQVNAHLARMQHFLSQANDRGIDVMPVFFEAIGEDPANADLMDKDINTSAAVESPSSSQILQPRDWQGYQNSPAHFVRRVINEYESNNPVPNVIAWEIMNEPGTDESPPQLPRHDFVDDMLVAADEATNGIPLTMGCREPEFNRQYGDGDVPELDIYQYHHNLPTQPEGGSAAFETQLQNAEQIANQDGKPMWLTEWQRFRGGQYEPPSRFLPDYENMASTVRDAERAGRLQGDFFWGLMLKPAYIMAPRNDGRINGIFHRSGVPFDLSDAEAIAGQSLDMGEYHTIPDWIAQGDFPWPDVPNEDTGPPPGAAGRMAVGGAALGSAFAAGLVVSDEGVDLSSLFERFG